MKPKFKSRMKLLLLLTSLLLSTIIYPQASGNQSPVGYSNYSSTAKPNINDYLKSEVKSAFPERFKDDNKNDFKSLREFLKEKEDLSRALNEQKERYTYDLGQIARKEESALRLEGIISINPPDGQSTYYIPQFLISDYNSYDSGSISMTKDEIQKKIIEIRQKNKTAEDDLDKKMDLLNTNIKNAEQDIYNCIKRIDSALAPEYENQDFRINISICFTILIGILLISFFYIVYQKSDSTLSKELLSGNGLQFVTLFVLIIAIILFGILSILQGSELAAILSGISGYILGKGITPEGKLQDRARTDATGSPSPEGGEAKPEATKKNKGN